MTTGKRERARRGTSRSLLRGRIISIVGLKPQLPHARGPFTRVRFFELRHERVEIVGDLCLKDGRVIADPADSIALRNILAEPLRVDQGSKPPLWLDPLCKPQAFFKALLKQYGHGTYFWAEAVAMNNDTQKG